MARKDLINLRNRPATERKRIASMGAKAATAVKLRKKTFKETVALYLQNNLSPEKLAEFKKEFPDVNLEEIKAIDAIVLAQINKAAQGDKASAEFIRDTAGEKPVEKREVDNKSSIAITIKKIDIEERAEQLRKSRVASGIN